MSPIIQWPIQMQGCRQRRRRGVREVTNGDGSLPIDARTNALSLFVASAKRSCLPALVASLVRAVIPLSLIITEKFVTQRELPLRSKETIGDDSMPGILLVR